MLDKERVVVNIQIEKISRETLNRCLEAARLAPSACNSQPWKFIIIKNKELKDKVSDAAFSGIYLMNSFARNAKVLILVIREDSKIVAKAAQVVQGLKYNLIDIGIACQHFILQAAEEELGTCWIGWFNSRAVKKY